LLSHSCSNDTHNCDVVDDDDDDDIDSTRDTPADTLPALDRETDDTA
jgi:hypothetical protein